jgi:hypothetical protein
MTMMMLSSTVMDNEDRSQEPDKKRNYALSIIWEGLLDMCHRDGIREADGPFMMLMWRVNMVRFWQQNNPKYISHAHRILAGKAMLSIFYMKA